LGVSAKSGVLISRSSAPHFGLHGGIVVTCRQRRPLPDRLVVIVRRSAVPGSVRLLSLRCIDVVATLPELGGRFIIVRMFCVRLFWGLGRRDTTGDGAIFVLADILLCSTTVAIRRFGRCTSDVGQFELVVVVEIRNLKRAAHDRPPAFIVAIVAIVSLEVPRAFRRCRHSHALMGEIEFVLLWGLRVLCSVAVELAAELGGLVLIGASITTPYGAVVTFSFAAV
jgi:hypothetical protein